MSRWCWCCRRPDASLCCVSWADALVLDGAWNAPRTSTYTRSAGSRLGLAVLISRAVAAMPPPLQVTHNWCSMLLSALSSALLAYQLTPQWQRSAPRLTNGLEAWLDRDGGGMAPPDWQVPGPEAVAEANRCAVVCLLPCYIHFCCWTCARQSAGLETGTSTGSTACSSMMRECTCRPLLPSFAPRPTHLCPPTPCQSSPGWSPST